MYYFLFYRVNDCADELNNLLKRQDFNSIYFIDCLPEIDETLEIFGKLHEQNKKAVIRDQHKGKYAGLIEKLKKIDIIHNSELCAQMLVKKTITHTKKN